MYGAEWIFVSPDRWNHSKNVIDAIVRRFFFLVVSWYSFHPVRTNVSVTTAATAAAPDTHSGKMFSHISFVILVIQFYLILFNSVMLSFSHFTKIGMVCARATLSIRNNRKMLIQNAPSAILLLSKCMSSFQLFHSLMVRTWTIATGFSVGFSTRCCASYFLLGFFLPLFKTIVSSLVLCIFDCFETHLLPSTKTIFTGTVHSTMEALWSRFSRSFIISYRKYLF